VTTESALDPESRLAEAEQRGFIRGLNVGFLTVGTLAAAVVCQRLLFDIPRFEEVFKQIKVPMPGLTLLAMQTRFAAAGLFLLLIPACIWATKTQGQNRFTIVLNALLFGGALFWLFVVTLALQLPLISILEGIGQRRP
jgi:uncharacterized membrane protein YphA (DoxX/SURF4 family)